MTLAVIVPTFNRSAFLKETIAAVQRQTWTDWQMIVVDDGSSDDTVEVVRAATAGDRRIQLVGQEHRGIAAARNRGMSALPPVDFVTFLDDDDIWDHDALERLVEALGRHPEAVGVYGLARRLESGRSVARDALEERQLHRVAVEGGKMRVLPTHEPTTFEVMAFASVIMTPGCAVVRSSALHRAGAFREPAADWDMWLRLTIQGPLVLLPEPVISYRSHPRNESTNILRNSRRKLIVHWRLLWSPVLTSAQRRTAWFAFVHYYGDLSRLARTFARIVRRFGYGRVGAA